MSENNNGEGMTPPLIAPAPQTPPRPLWSVMIPTFNCANYLRKTLESVLEQDPGADKMQIEVVDDCSTKDSPESVVQELGRGRVALYRKPKNEGAIANFNTCIERSRGHLVHILHGDDFVLPGFYEKIEAISNKHADTALFASRSFFVDENGVVTSVSERLADLEAGGHKANDFYYSTALQFPGVVVRRSFYEKHGGFLPGLVHTADCEMWARAIGMGGGLVLPEVLACYRVFAANDTGRLARTGENLRDLERLNLLFCQRYPDFDQKRAARRICEVALSQAGRFSRKGDAEAARANRDYWRRNAPPLLRLRRLAGQVARRVFN